MVTRQLRGIFMCIFLFTAAMTSRAQQIHFVYIQTTDLQPFYVKMGPKIISSSSDGYVILPKLVDGNYDLVIGFPKDKYPEEHYNVQVSGKNLGFLLKDFDEKGWGLFDRQSYQITMGGPGVSQEPSSQQQRSDAFSKMLATVVKDSTILQKNAPEPATGGKPKAYQAVPTAISNTPSYQAPVLLTRDQIGDSVRMVYVTSSADGSDTVLVWLTPAAPKAVVSKSFIPGVPAPPHAGNSGVSGNSAGAAPNTAAQNSSAPQPVFLDQITTAVGKDSSQGAGQSQTTGGPTTETSQPAAAPRETLYNGQGKGLDSANAPGSTPAGTSPNQLPTVINSSSINSDCKDFAGNADFLFLRKKMAAATTSRDMIALADREFHLKCFSTSQIKNLAYLFLSDKGKFNFLVTAYPFTSDSDQFYTLKSLLSDPFYINKFKEMVHK